MNWDSAVEGFWLARRRDLSEHTIVDYALTFRRFGAWIENGEVETVVPRVKMDPHNPRVEIVVLT